MPEEKAETKYYSLEEIGRNTGEGGTKCWIIIKDNVYDVTEYLEEHPGGAELITEWAGKDGTKAFDEFGHSGDAKKDLKKYKIGEVIEEERKKKQQKKTEKPEKKEKTVVKVMTVEEKANRKSCLNIITCGLCG